MQLIELTKLNEESSTGLDPFKESEEFQKQNEFLRKEVEKIQHNLKITKQSKFRRNLNNWEKGEWQK